MANDVGNERSELPVRLIIGALVVTGLAVTAASLGFGSIGLAENAWGNVGQVIAVLGVVAVVIERAVEVYVSKRYDARKLRLNRPVARAQNKLTRAQQALREERERREGSTTQQERENDGQMTALQAAVENASESVDQAEDSNWLPVSKMQAEKLRDASVLSVVFGITVALSGVRVMGPLFKLPTSGEALGWQLGLFQTADTVLTGLVLAGGAAGVHAMFGALKGFKPTP